MLLLGSCLDSSTLLSFVLLPMSVLAPLLRASGWRPRMPRSSRAIHSRSQPAHIRGANSWRLIAVCFLMAGCAGDDGVDFEPTLHVENGTELAVEVFVNGDLVAEFQPMVVGAVEAGLPQLPWRVEARTHAGRRLISFDVAPGDVVHERGPGDVEHFSGPLGRADLSCGRLSVWAGDFTPSGAPPGPGTPGDCQP